VAWLLAGADKLCTKYAKAALPECELAICELGPKLVDKLVAYLTPPVKVGSCRLTLSNPR
jgi:hypothetical protein